MGEGGERSEFVGELARTKRSHRKFAANWRRDARHCGCCASPAGGAQALVQGGRRRVRLAPGNETRHPKQTARARAASAGREEGSAMKTSTKVLGLALGMALAVAVPATAAELKMMTGPQGGSWIPLGGQLKDMWEKAVPGLAVQALPGAGIANVRARRGRQGRYRVSAIRSRRSMRSPARRRSTSRTSNVCNVATLYPQYYQFVVQCRRRRQQDRAISRARAITTQQRGNTGELITAPAARGQRAQLQRRQDELRRLYRLGEPDAGRPRRRIRARHADSGRRRHGSRRRARHQADRPVRQLRRRCARSIPATRWSRSRRAPIRSRTRT